MLGKVCLRKSVENGYQEASWLANEGMKNALCMNKNIGRKCSQNVNECMCGRPFRSEIVAEKENLSVLMNVIVMNEC